MILEINYQNEYQPLIVDYTDSKNELFNRTH